MFSFTVESFQFWLTVIIILCIWFLVCHVYTQYPEYNRQQSLISAIPGPPGLPFFGNGCEIGTTIDLYQKMPGWIEKYGKIIKLVLGTLVQYCTTDLGLIQYITNNDSLVAKARFFELSGALLGGEGLINSSGEKWRKRRRIITPAFHFRTLTQFIEIFDKHADTLVEKLQGADNMSLVNIQEYVSLAALDIICETTVGVPLNAQREPDSPYVKSIGFLIKKTIDRSFTPKNKIDIPYSFEGASVEEIRNLRTIHQYSRTMVKKRREELKLADSSEADIGTNNDVLKKISLLDTLLQAVVDGEPLTDKDIQEEIDTIIFAGHDTSATAIALVIYALAKYPSIQEKVYDEIKSIFGEKQKEPLHHSNLAQMKYFDMVLKEVMRMYTLVPFIGRAITDEFRYGQYTFLKGTTMMLYTHGVHMDPDNFEDPQTFNPDRWLDISDERSLIPYLPFSTGLRKCTGEKYATLEIKTIVCKVLMNFEIVPSEPDIDLILASEGILKSSNGVHVGLKPRTVA